MASGIPTFPSQTGFPGGSAGSSSGAVSPWFSNVATYVQGLQPTLLAATLASEVNSISLEMEATSATGTGSVTMSTTAPGGVAVVASGATPGSFKTLRNRNGKNEPVVTNMRTAKYAFAVRAQIVQTQASCALLVTSLSDEVSGGPTLGVLSSQSTTNLSLWCLATSIDTGVAIDTSKNYTYLVIADGTNFKAYLGDANGLNFAQIGAVVAQSTAPAAAAAFATVAENLVTAANVAHNVDSVLVLTERAA